MARRFLIAANWKMNPIPVGATEPGSPYFEHAKVDVVVFPTFLDLQECVQAGIVTGAQCGHPEASGAFTGDVSMGMLASRGMRYVLCGHSERRQFHDERNRHVALQVEAAIKAQLNPIVCVGEKKKDRDRKRHKQVVKKQLKCLPLDSDRLTIAYEPVWAIGKGAQPATHQEAQEMHEFIRGLLPANRSDETRIIYGGNLNADNAEDILKQPDIDGGLVGGASLRPVEFNKIIGFASRLS